MHCLIPAAVEASVTSGRKEIYFVVFIFCQNWQNESRIGGERKYASWQKYLWFSFLKQILSMQVPLWRKTAISSCTEFVDKKFHAHLWESHCKDLVLYEMIMREPLQRFIFIWNNFFIGFWSLQNFLWSYQWMDAGKRKWLSPET